MQRGFRNIALAACLLAAPAAEAATTNFSFNGTLNGDADVMLFTFTIGATSDVVLRSYSYAGGTQADGTVVAAGGFDPIVALWDAAGMLIQEYDDGPEPVPADPATGATYDAHLVLNALLPGTYTASIAQYANFAVSNKLADGFSESSATFTSRYSCSNGSSAISAETTGPASGPSTSLASTASSRPRPCRCPARWA